MIRGAREGLIGVPQEGAGVGKIAERGRHTLGSAEKHEGNNQDTARRNVDCGEGSIEFVLARDVAEGNDRPKKNVEAQPIRSFLPNLRTLADRSSHTEDREIIVPNSVDPQTRLGPLSVVLHTPPLSKSLGRNELTLHEASMVTITMT